MAISLTNNSFVGIASRNYIAPAIMEAPTLAKEYVTILQGIKKAYKLRLADTSNMLQADSCNFTALGTVTLDERTLTPVAMMVNYEECNKDLKTAWDSLDQNAGYKSGPSKIYQDFIHELIQKKVALSVENYIWQGATAGSGGIYASDPALTLGNGFVTLALADSNTIKISATASGFTTTTAQGEMDRILNAAPDALYLGQELAFNVSAKAYRALAGSIQTTYIANSSVADVRKGLGDLDWRGVPVHIVGIADSKIVLAEKKNLFVGMDLLSDENEFTVLDLSQTTGDNKTRLIMRFNLGVQYANSSEIVVYS